MGLWVSHDSWNAPYGSFSRWREAIADAAGYNWEFVDVPKSHKWLEERGHRNPWVSSKTLSIDWGSLKPEHYLGEWDRIPVRMTGEPDPLLLLLTHSDCEGRIKCEFLLDLADRLESLAPSVESEPDSDWRSATLRFAKGCRSAHREGSDLLFS